MSAVVVDSSACSGVVKKELLLLGTSTHNKQTSLSGMHRQLLLSQKCPQYEFLTPPSYCHIWWSMPEAKFCPVLILLACSTLQDQHIPPAGTQPNHQHQSRCLPLCKSTRSSGIESFVILRQSPEMVSEFSVIHSSACVLSVCRSFLLSFINFIACGLAWGV